MAGKKSPKACERASVSPVTRERVARVQDYAVGVLRERGVSLTLGSALAFADENGTRRSVSLARSANALPRVAREALRSAFTNGGVLVLANAQHNSHARYYVRAVKVSGSLGFVVVTVSSVDGHAGTEGIVSVHRSVVVPSLGVFRVRDAGVRFVRSCACADTVTLKAFDANYLDTVSRGVGGVRSDVVAGSWLAGRIVDALYDPLTMNDLRPAKAESAHNFLVANWSHAEVASWQLPQNATARIGHRY
jgi:hypothetical protein